MEPCSFTLYQLIHEKNINENYLNLLSTSFPLHSLNKSFQAELNLPGQHCKIARYEEVSHCDSDTKADNANKGHAYLPI